MYCQHCAAELLPSSQFCQSCGKQNGILNPPYQAASLGRRFANSFLDGFFVGIINFILGIVALWHPDQSYVYYFGWATGLLYYIAFESLWQRTPAKWITGTKVVSQDGTPASFGKIVGRSFARLIPFDAFSFLFGRPTGWHDRLSKTLVVPTEYTPEQVANINLNAYPHSKGRTIFVIIAIIIVCIAMFGLIASVILLSLNSARIKSRDAKRNADVYKIAAGLELYRADYDQYPNALQQLAPKYILAVPTAPEPADGSCTASQNEYIYRLIGDSYTLTFCYGQPNGGLEAGPHVMTPHGIDKKDAIGASREQNNTGTSEREQADYEEGYRAGYVDGRGKNAQLGDTYSPPTPESRKSTYALGYLEGFSKGCHEGNFDDCAQVDRYIEALTAGSNTLPPQLR